MTHDEWLGLPTAVRLDVLWSLLGSQLHSMPVPGASVTATPAVPAPRQQSDDARPPKYDGKLARKGGYVFMSEMLLADLEWWLAKKREGAQSGGQYADRDRKTATELERWIGYRTAAPGERWQGTRGEQRVKAAAPSRDPELHPWPARGPARLDVTDEDRMPAGGSYGELDYGGASDDEIPF